MYPIVIAFRPAFVVASLPIFNAFHADVTGWTNHWAIKRNVCFSGAMSAQRLRLRPVPGDIAHL